MKRDFANAYKSYRDFANICRICAEGIRPSLTPSCNQLLLVGPYLRAQLTDRHDNKLNQSLYGPWTLLFQNLIWRRTGVFLIQIFSPPLFPASPSLLSISIIGCGDSKRLCMRFFNSSFSIDFNLFLAVLGPALPSTWTASEQLLQRKSTRGERGKGLLCFPVDQENPKDCQDFSNDF